MHVRTRQSLTALKKQLAQQEAAVRNAQEELELQEEFEAWDRASDITLAKWEAKHLSDGEG